MTAVHQIVGRATRGDPAAEAALTLQPLLRRLGPSEIYSPHLDPALEGQVRPLADFVAGRRSVSPPAVVYHAGAGDPDAVAVLLEGDEPILLVYQNVPPAESFILVEPRAAERLALAEAQLELLQPRVRRALADTEAAAGRLRELGFPDVRVSPLPGHWDRLVETDSHPPTAHHLATQLEGPLLLCAGPVLPPQRLDLLVETYDALATYLAPDVHLAVVGPAPLPAYVDIIQGFIEKLDLHGVWIQPEVDPEPLATFHRAAAAFVTTTEDPGFCRAAVQALAFDLPVVARAAGGVPETLDGAGLLVPAGEGPLVLAEAVAAVLDDAGLRTALGTGGRARLADLEPARAESGFLGHLADVL